MKTNDTLIVGESKISGRGVFAGRDFRSGERIGYMQGKQSSFMEFQGMHDSGNVRISCDHFQDGVRSYITLDEPYVFINHSCNPNIGIRGKRMIVALRNIKEGEELTYDYSATEWTPQDYPPYYTDGWPMKCACGGRTCRRKIACFPYLPKALQRKYVKRGIIQTHVLKKLGWPKEKSRCFVCETQLGLGDSR